MPCAKAHRSSWETNLHQYWKYNLIRNNLACNEGKGMNGKGIDFKTVSLTTENAENAENAESAESQRKNRVFSLGTVFAQASTRQVNADPPSLCFAAASERR